MSSSTGTCAFRGEKSMGRLRAIVESIPDHAFAGRLLRVYEEASQTIAKMGQLELGKYEDMAQTGVPASEMWEEVAPVIRDTVADVNRLLSTVRELFPLGTAGGIADLIGEALSEVTAGDTEETLLERHKEEASHHIQVLANVLASEVSNLGERMRSPEVVSDRWNLLADLQEIRGKFRSIVGDMVFLSAFAFAPVTREQVVPDYVEDVQEAIVARRAVTDLAREMAVHHGHISSSRASELSQRVAELIRDLDNFGCSSSYVVLRTADKRRVVEFRSFLHRSGKEADPEKMAKAVAEFAYYAHGLSHINKRACLMERDREVLSKCGILLESAEFLCQEESQLSVDRLKQVIAQANSLYGRHPSLDSYLRKARKRDFSALDSSGLKFEIEHLRGLLTAAAAF